MVEPITTDRLLLRPLRAQDAPEIAALISRLEVSRWLTHVPYPYALADAEAFLDRHSNEDRVWAITQDGSFAGIITILTELGYWLGQPFWGHGFMTEAACAVVEDHFTRTADALPSGYHLGNAASANVLNKLGFVKTKQRTAYSQSQRCEVVIQGMHLTQAAWEARA